MTPVTAAAGTCSSTTSTPTTATSVRVVGPAQSLADVLAVVVAHGVVVVLVTLLVWRVMMSHAIGRHVQTTTTRPTTQLVTGRCLLLCQIALLVFPQEGLADLGPVRGQGLCGVAAGVARDGGLAAAVGGTHREGGVL
jgi:hypothetical protein